MRQLSVSEFFENFFYSYWVDLCQLIFSVKDKATHFTDYTFNEEDF